MRTVRSLPRALMLGVAALVLTLPATAAHAEPSLDEQISKLSHDMEATVEDYNRVNADLAKSRTRSAEAAARLTALQRDHDAALASVGALATDAYKAGQFATLSALLDSGSSGALLSRVSTLDQVSRARQQAVTDLVARRTAVEEERRTIDTLVAQQAAAQRTLAGRKAQIEKDLDRLYQLREAAYGAPEETPTAPVSTPAPSAASGKAGIAVQFAQGALGKPYVWAASGPSGYDCSGLTLAAWRAAGASLTHAASVQFEETSRVTRAQLQPGDLVFYNDLGHVALYIGNNQVIHAPTFGEVVKIANIDMMPPYGYGRVVS